MILKFIIYTSHPSWVRGLKPDVLTTEREVKCVAPLVGAWIETSEQLEKKSLEQSHPSWVRGLKLEHAVGSLNYNRRTPRGCVD